MSASGRPVPGDGESMHQALQKAAALTAPPRTPDPHCTPPRARPGLHGGTTRWATLGWVPSAEPEASTRGGSAEEAAGNPGGNDALPPYDAHERRRLCQATSPRTKVGHAGPGGTITFSEEADFLCVSWGQEQTPEVGRRAVVSSKCHQAGGGWGWGTFQTGKSQHGMLLGASRGGSAPEQGPGEAGGRHVPGLGPMARLSLGSALVATGLGQEAAPPAS